MPAGGCLGAGESAGPRPGGLAKSAEFMWGIYEAPKAKASPEGKLPLERDHHALERTCVGGLAHETDACTPGQ